MKLPHTEQERAKALHPVDSDVRQTRVMIIEDSRTVREFLRNVIDGDPRLRVVYAAASAEDALQVLDNVVPDVISMDIHLPGMNGLDATRRIMELQPTPVVIVSANVGRKDGDTHGRALRAGAVGVIATPTLRSADPQASGADQMCNQLLTMSQICVVRQRFNRGSRRKGKNEEAELVQLLARRASYAIHMVGIVSSTGGPSALQRVLGALTPDFPVPVAIVQHMTPGFHQGFVSWLNDVSPLPVQAVHAADIPRPGHVYVAPPDRHLELAGAKFSLSRAAPVNAERPSGTHLLQSMALNLGSHAVGVVLTGMGTDGAVGLQAIRAAGGHTIAEDASTATVYGMPGAAVQLQAACESLPIEAIGPRLNHLVASRGELTSARSFP